MKKLLITTSSFFNRAGNQSMLESVKEYSKYYNVAIITTAPESNSFYLTTSEAKAILPKNINIYRSRNWFKSFFKTVLSLCQKLITKKKKKINVDTTLVNQSYNQFTSLSQLLTTSKLIFTELLLIISKKEQHPDIILAYEISGIPAGLYLANLFRKRDKKVTLVSRLQGTTLYGAIGNEKSLNSNNYSLDHAMYQKLKYFDLNIMTNDGTNGDKVLAYYSVPPEKILHLTNGIPSSIVQYGESKARRSFLNSDKIILSSVCRLIGWKRVYLSIEVINMLVNVHHYTNIELNIYGVGSDDEVAYLSQLIDKYGLDKFIKLHGGVTHDLIPKILDSSDFLISLYSFTNVTNPLLEALYLRCPIITIEDDNLNVILANELINSSLILNNASEDELIKTIVNYLISIDIKTTKLSRQEEFGRLGNIYTWKKRIENEKAHLDAISDF